MRLCPPARFKYAAGPPRCGLGDTSMNPNHLPELSGDSRRAFLAKAAAVAGSTIFFGCETYSAKGTQAPAAGALARLAKDEPIRMGVIGTGGMGTGHCHAIVELAKKN